MTSYPRVREQHIAVFGESGSGKTVLVSSFYGPTQEGAYKNDLWDLVADDTGQGNRLNRNYLGMRDRATTPPATRLASTTYYFSVRLKGRNEEASKKRSFDSLRLAWHDYPGEWFEESPSSDEEAARRIDTFRSLMRSDVALLLVDGQKLIDHKGEEDRYLKSLFTNFRQGLQRLEDEIVGDKGKLVEFPRIWIIALSKADLLPEMDVHGFRDLLLLNTEDDLERLRDTIASLIETSDALSVGEDFILLSSAKFQSTADNAAMDIDVTRQVGLDLILPIAAMLPLERRVLWQERMEIPRKVLESLADGADSMADLIATAKLLKLEKLLDKFPRIGPLTHRGAGAVAVVAKLVGPQLRELNEQARERRDYLTAALTQFKLDLEQGVAEKRFIKSLK